MVRTRSGKQFDIAAAIELSKITARSDESKRKSILAPGRRSRAKKSQPTTTLAQVSQRSRPPPKVSSGSKSSTLKDARGTTVIKASAYSGRKLRARTGQSTAALVLKQDSPVYEKKKREVAKYIERETDAAKTSKIRIRAGHFRGPAFKPPRVDLKNEYPRGFFSNTKKWKLGHQPFLNWKGPSTEAYWDFFHAFKDQYGPGKEDALKLDLMKEPLLPGHTYTGDGHRFHALIEPIISCATSNNNQKLASDSLFRKLTYKNGKQSNRISPNYHKLIKVTEKDLSEILRQSGRQNNNAKCIKALFNNVREENIRLRGLSADEAEKIQEEAENADEWTEGLLSLDFMVGMGMQEIFDKLVSYAGIACKTAACIMCFSFHYAVFAVDTHVFRLCQWAGWLPRNCTRDDAFKFFTIVIPPELHRDLHQGLWHHAQLCFRCSAKTYDKVDDPRWKEALCPLEQFGLVRFPNWERKSGVNNAEDFPSSAKKRSRERKSKHPDDMVTITLRTDKEVADAKATGHEVHETVIDDAFGARPDLSNVKTQLKRSLYITRAQESAFRDYQKSKTVKVQTKTVSRTRITVTEDLEITTTTLMTTAEGTNVHQDADEQDEDDDSDENDENDEEDD